MTLIHVAFSATRSGRRLRGWMVCIWGLAFVTQLVSVRASAQAEAMDIHWEEDGVCPAPPGLIADVVILLGGEVPSQPLPRFDLRTRARDGGGVEVELHVYSDQGESHRALGTADCHEASQAAAMLIALAIAPDAGGATEPEPAPASEPPVSLSRVPELDPEQTTRTDLEGWGLGVEGGVDVGQLPDPALFLGAGGFWWSHALRLEALATWAGPSELAITEQSGAFIELFSAGGLARGCLMGRVGNVRLGPCAALRGGYVFGKAIGLTDGQNSGALWLSAGLDARLEWRLSQGLAIQVTWGVEGGIVRPNFRIRNATTRHTLPPINTLGGLGIALYL